MHGQLKGSILLSRDTAYIKGSMHAFSHRRIQGCFESSALVTSTEAAGFDLTLSLTTSKTMCATIVGLEKLLRKEISRLVLYLFHYSKECLVPASVAQVDQGLNPKIPLGKGRSIGLSGGLFNKCQVTFTK